MSEVEPEWLGYVRTTKLTRLCQNGSARMSRFSAHAHNEVHRIPWACLSGLGAALAHGLGPVARLDEQPLW